MINNKKEKEKKEERVGDGDNNIKPTLENKIYLAAMKYNMQDRLQDIMRGDCNDPDIQHAREVIYDTLIMTSRTP